MDERAELLTRLAAAVAVAVPGDALPVRLCEAVRRVLGADGASITMHAASPHRVTLAATDAVVAQLDDLHHVLGHGPAAEALSTGEPVVLDVTRPGADWELFAERAARATPARTVFAIPMRAGGQVLGVLCLYRSAPGPLAEPLPRATFLADAIGAAILHDPTTLADLTEVGSWPERAQIHQATGMVVAQLALPVTDALAILRAHAFALDRTLLEVARAVLARELVFQPEEWS